MEPYKFSFEKLEVWNIAKELAILVYRDTVGFPAEEKFGLTSQVRRAALSVGANIAEGSTRTSFKDQAHFSRIAYSSLMELLNHLIIASNLGFMDTQKMVRYRELIQVLSVKLTNLKTTQLKRIKRV